MAQRQPEHVIIVAREGKFYHHECLDQYCRHTCYIRHRTVTDAAGCAHIFHACPCVCYGSALNVIDVDITAGMFA